MSTSKQKLKWGSAIKPPPQKDVALLFSFVLSLYALCYSKSENYLTTTFQLKGNPNKVLRVNVHACMCVCWCLNSEYVQGGGSL
jgi:hypothetical protein